MQAATIFSWCQHVVLPWGSFSFPFNSLRDNWMPKTDLEWYYTIPKYANYDSFFPPNASTDINWPCPGWCWPMRWASPWAAHCWCRRRPGVFSWVQRCALSHSARSQRTWSSRLGAKKGRLCRRSWLMKRSIVPICADLCLLNCMFMDLFRFWTLLV